MIYIEKEKLVVDDFIVLDENDSPVTGLIFGNFTIKLFNPSKIEITLGISLDEVGNGLYRIQFTPDTLGEWELLVYHSTYFPFGKGQNYQCVDSLSGNANDMIKRILGLSQENYRIFSPTYIVKNNQSCMTSAIIKIYSTSIDCDSDTNEIEEYHISATFDNQAKMTGYKVKKI